MFQISCGVNDLIWKYSAAFGVRSFPSNSVFSMLTVRIFFAYEVEVFSEQMNTHLGL